MNSASGNDNLLLDNNKRIPRGIGYAIGTMIAIISFIVIGILLGNIPLGVAWFTSGYAIGFTLEGENQKPFSIKQKRLAASSVISGGVSLVLTLILFNVVLF
jgi:hypothetical protein